MSEEYSIEDADQKLWDLGLICVGRSNKSRSSYWATSADPDVRLRLSDHAVAYESSDCAICLGLAQDDDVRLEDESSVMVAVKMLLEKEIQHETEKTYKDDCDDSDDGESDQPKEWHRAEAIESLRRWGVEWRKGWVDLLPES